MGLFSLWANKDKTKNDSGINALTLSEVFSGDLSGPSALRNDVVLAIVNLIANTGAMLPLKVLSEDSKGSLFNFKSADEAKILTEKPNSYQDPYTFKYFLFHCAVVYGESFIFKVKSGKNLLELRPISPEIVKIRFVNGIKLYDIYTLDEKKAPVLRGTFTNNEIVHILNYTEDGITAQSLLQKISLLIQADNTLKRFTKKYFANGATPSMYVKVDGNKEDMERAVQGFAKDFASADNAGKIPFVANGVTITPLPVNAKDAMMIEALKYYVEAICRSLGVPPSQVFSKDGASYNSMEMDNIQFFRSCIGPLVSKFESALDYGLFLGQKHYVKFDTDSLLRTTTLEKYNAYRLSLGGNAWRTVNEVRALDDLNPVEGGDVIMKMVNTQDINTTTQGVK